MQLTVFEDRESASEAAARQLADILAQQLAVSDDVWLAVSGGSTPKACYRTLSKQPLGWERVNVTLTDERLVPIDHPDRNAGMLKDHLFCNHASQANYVSLEEVPDKSFSAVLLGMGSDGHFASLFPDAKNLREALDVKCVESFVAIDTAASEHRRVSLTLARLLQTSVLLLLVFGEDKRRILETPGDLPIGYLFDQNVVPVQVLWAP